MKPVAKDLHFPFGGLSCERSFHDVHEQAGRGVYYAHDVENVWPRDAFARRLRGGSRPGLQVFHAPMPEVWCWPNGEPIEFPDGQEINAGLLGGMPGSNVPHIIDTHPMYSFPIKKGEAPKTWQCQTVYRGRMVVACDDAWYASRSTEWSDWDYGGDGEDFTRPVAGNVALAGDRGEPITALISIADRVLYVATKHSICAYFGELTSGERHIRSTEVGIVSGNAWAYDGQRVVFLSPKGLYALAPETPPQLLSDSLPDQLRNVKKATLAYDSENEGFHILTEGGDYFFDVVDGNSIWPMRWGKPECKPLAVSRIENDEVRRCLFLCTDGQFRFFDRLSGQDDDAPVASHVSFGPFRMAPGDDRDAILDTITLTTAYGSGGTSLALAHGPSAESAAFAVRQLILDRIFIPSWNHVARPRRRGAWFSIVIASDSTWAFEGLLVTGKQLGRLR